MGLLSCLLTIHHGPSLVESGEASEKSGKEGRGEEQGKEGKQKYQEKWLTHFKTPCFVVTKVKFSISNAQKRSSAFSISTVNTSTLINSLFYASLSKVHIFHADIKFHQGKPSLPPAHHPSTFFPEYLSPFSVSPNSPASSSRVCSLETTHSLQVEKC